MSQQAEAASQPGPLAAASPGPDAAARTDLVLFTTVDAGGPRMASFERLVASIADNMAELPTTRLKLWVLLQNCPAERAESLSARLPGFVQVLPADTRVPLSAARNILIRAQMQAGGFRHGTIVAFPDDDAWYPAGFLAALVGVFEAHPDLDFWFCRYGTSPGPLRAVAAETAPATRRTVIRKSSSNTIFVRGSIAAAVGYFDETLGLGTALGSAEDIDYALRVFGRARLCSCRDEILVGHRDKIVGLRGKYYQGGLFVLARHARRGGFSEFARKLVIGLYLTIRGELTLSAYRVALRTAFTELSAARTSRS